jgi:DNA-binding response OmpR family regulator
MTLDRDPGLPPPTAERPDIAGRAAIPASAANTTEPPLLRVVEPDMRLAGRLRAFFAEHGLSSGLHGTMEAMLEDLARHPPRLVLLGGEDMARPLAALRRLRAASRVPCILLVGGLDESGGVLAREAGADDAASRGAPLPAVLARVRAVLRRAEWGRGEASPTITGLDGWRLLPERRQLLRPDGRECRLTTAEFDLMRVLVERRGRAVSRDTIARTVFGRPFRPEDRTVDNLVLRLRRKLETAAEPQAIRTVRGAGYMFAGFGSSRGGDSRGAA